MVISRIGSGRTQNSCTEKVPAPTTKIPKELPRSLIMIILSSIWLLPSPIMPSMISPTKSRRIWKKTGRTKFTKWGHNQLLIKYRNVEQKKTPRKRGYHLPKKTLPPSLAGLFRRICSSCRNRTQSREHSMLTWARNQRFKTKIITPLMLASPK